MKKILALFLMCVMFAVLCACGAKTNTGEMPPDVETEEKSQELEREMIGMDALVADLDNLARAEQHIGNETHLFGKITYIGTDSINLQDLFSRNKFTVPMDKETLVQLDVDEYIAVYAVVEGLDRGAYVFADGKRLEMTVMDEYVINRIHSMDSYTLLSEHSRTVATYVLSRGNVFKSKASSDEEIKAYVTGKWSRWWNGQYLHFAASMELKPDGKFIETTDGPGGIETDTGRWSVKDGKFEGAGYYIAEVYKLSETMMVIANIEGYEVYDLYIRD